MTNITIDQLIADLCVCRGKEPRIGTMFVDDCFVTNGAWNLKMTDGTHHFRIELVGSHEDGKFGDGQRLRDGMRMSRCFRNASMPMLLI